MKGNPTKKLRIAVWHNLPSGGGKRQLYYHVKGLMERGHTVESWCPDSADQKYLPLSSVTREHVLPLEMRDGLNDSPWPLNTVRALTRAMEEHSGLCAKQINNGEFDVLYANACVWFRTTPIARYVNLPSAL